MNNGAPSSAARQIEGALALLVAVQGMKLSSGAATLIRSAERRARLALDRLTEWERARELEELGRADQRERFAITPLGKIALEVEDCIEDERGCRATRKTGGPMTDSDWEHRYTAGHLLKLDYDGARLPGDWMARVGFVLRQFGVRVVWVRLDRTRRGWHVTAALSRHVPPLRLVLLQALCGSDYRRETFNGVRAGRLRGVPPFWLARFNQLFTVHDREAVI